MGLVLLKIELILGLGIWLLIAALNNLFDPKTNHHLISGMMKMTAIEKEVQPLGKGLLWRAFKKTNCVYTFLRVIACYQFLCALFLIISVASFCYGTFFHLQSVAFDLELINTALVFFNAIWLFFLCGGLWFGYWIKFFPAQTTHFILLLTGITTAILINIHI